MQDPVPNRWNAVPELFYRKPVCKTVGNALSFKEGPIYLSVTRVVPRKSLSSLECISLRGGRLIFSLLSIKYYKSRKFQLNGGKKIDRE